MHRKRGGHVHLPVWPRKQTTFEPHYQYEAPVFLDERRQSKLAKYVKQAKSDRAEALHSPVHHRLNLLIGRGTSTHKTTFARHLLKSVPNDERLIAIEEAFELFPTQPNSVYLLAERASGSEWSTNVLLQASLRMRPDRIAIGELRGFETLTYLETINTWHGGSVTKSTPKPLNWRWIDWRSWYCSLNTVDQCRGSDFHPPLDQCGCSS